MSLHHFYLSATIAGKNGTKPGGECCICKTPSRLRHVISNTIGDESAVAVGEDPQAHRLVDPMPHSRGEVGQPLGREGSVV
jgi:hypothetical protein